MREAGRYGRRGSRRAAAFGGLLVTLVVLLSAAAGPAGAASGTRPGGPGAAPGANWSAYLDGPLHHSYAVGATAITPANAGGLTATWNWRPDPPAVAQLGYAVTASPTVYDGVIYVGANNGTFYALDEATGAVLWRHAIGYVSQHTKGCGYRGFISTATVAPAPVSAGGALTVYVAAADGYLYAFSAATGATEWRSVVGIPSATENNYFNWSSPAISDGHVYVGISSQCDDPLVRGGLLEFDQATGSRLHAFYTVPAGDIGGSIWSSAAVSGSGTVVVTTGNGPASSPDLGLSTAVVALNGTTLAPRGSWQVPIPQQLNPDDDFGGSPTLFMATLPGQKSPTQMVGACNKNRVYYAWDLADLGAGPVWQDQLGTPVGGAECLAAAAYDGHHLFVVGASGNVEKLDPATGHALWTTALPAGADGSPTLNGAGLLAVPTYDGADLSGAVYLLDASTGAVVATLSSGDSPVFAQPVFAGGSVFVASLSGGLTEYSLPG